MKYAFIFLLIFIKIGYAQQSDFSHINFHKADSIALNLKGESLKNLPILSYKLTAELTTDTEKFRAIYLWVSTNIENDYESYLKTKKKRKKLSNDRVAFLEWNNNFTPKVFERLVNYKKTACTGYAYLVRELANLADIHCQIVDGFGRTATLNLTENSEPNHSWNAVKLNNKWYLCDATWSAGSIVLEDNLPKFKSDYFDGYFLADPDLFLKNHYPINTKWALTTFTPEFKDFIAGPVIYKDAFSLNITPISPKMELDIFRGETIAFKLNAPDIKEIDHFSLLLNNGHSNNKTEAKITVDNDIYNLEYSFLRPGFYSVHILWEDKIIATHIVKVKRR
ncbi:hypothetical protein H0I23_10870 [Cellulophaga sp. HaHaR_3_176]|uniref:transglutaminase domain-containing protein n=1 Tax=Cellulophaga sp. HaHaR_3_176 TaxID=1942464 RepID=UPI001C1F6382|nr:transglutaminase domain-containing protein [Cellulophaga sp. HaHaR_3_176]QWX82963.1 hypothetical protein H0I23_10870 [Cellulophaga sp. HaHaR_3_176]